MPITIDLRAVTSTHLAIIASTGAGQSYLGEKMPRHGKRTRGANFTSADAAAG